MCPDAHDEFLTNSGRELLQRLKVWPHTTTLHTGDR